MLPPYNSGPVGVRDGPGPGIRRQPESRDWAPWFPVRIPPRELAGDEPPVRFGVSDALGLVPDGVSARLPGSGFRCEPHPGGSCFPESRHDSAPWVPGRHTLGGERSPEARHASTRAFRVRAR
jgi:hypothetical protein